MATKILALNLGPHDSNYSYFDGNQLHYIKLERIKKVKRYTDNDDWSWMKDVKNIWGITPKDVDHIAINGDPEDFLYDDVFQRIPESIHEVIDGTKNATLLPKGTFSNIDHDNIWYIGHHYAHSLSTWMLEKETPDVRIVVDGLGDGRTWSVFKDNKLVNIGLEENGSIGTSMVDASYLLGIDGDYMDLAGKLMGLQSYGNIDSSYLEKIKDFNINDINHILSFDNWLSLHEDSLVARMKPLDWIRTVHEHMGDVLVDFISEYANPEDVISYSGGVAQNVVWNTKIKSKFPKIIIPPHSADEGLSLGGIEYLRRELGLEPFKFNHFPYAQFDVSPSDEIDDEGIIQIANLLAEGKIVAWYQGHGEIGPRALGNRSILMDARILNGKEKINKIKNRENYRPFGASVLLEHSDKYFDSVSDDPYMLLTSNVKTDEYKCITHIDGTCRIQTVEKSNHPYRKLLEEFYKITGSPILLNTSLNLAGKPLCSHLESALDFFRKSDVDCLVMGNTIYTKDA